MLWLITGPRAPRGLATLVAGSLILAGCSSGAAPSAPTSGPAPTAAAAAPKPTTAAAAPTSAVAPTAAAAVAKPTAAPAAAANPTTAPAAAPAGGELHIADVHPFTGKYAGVGTASIEGANAAAAAINDAGGVLGKKVIIDQVDTVGDPADAVPALNKELSSNHPVGVIGPGGLEIGAVQPILDRSNVPFMLQAGNTAFDKVTDQLLWRANPSDSQLGVAMADYALKKGYKKAALVFSTIESAQTLKEPITAVFTKQGGTIVLAASLTDGIGSPEFQRR